MLLYNNTLEKKTIIHKGEFSIEKVEVINLSPVEKHSGGVEEKQRASRNLNEGKMFCVDYNLSPMNLKAWQNCIYLYWQLRAMSR